MLLFLVLVLVIPLVAVVVLAVDLVMISSLVSLVFNSPRLLYVLSRVVCLVCKMLRLPRLIDTISDAGKIPL